MKSLPSLRLLLCLALLSACTTRLRSPARDAARPDSGGSGDGAVDTRVPPVDTGGLAVDSSSVDASRYDPRLGNPFTGAIELSDSRVEAVDPAIIRATPSPCRAPVLARVTRAVDGDTVRAAGVSEVLNRSVRLIGVDTPEVAHPGLPTSQCYGDEASVFTSQLNGRLVWLVFDRDCTDRFGRLLAYLYIGGGTRDMWERQLVRRGFGTRLVVGRNDAHAGVLGADQTAAQAAGAGLWSACP